FFFSSRRRHTRSKRDWSSDVCSSDLRLPVLQAPRLSSIHGHTSGRLTGRCLHKYILNYNLDNSVMSSFKISSSIQDNHLAYPQFYQIIHNKYMLSTKYITKCG